VATGIYVGGYASHALEQLAALKLDVYVLGRDAGGSSASLHAALELGDGARGSGIAVPFETPPRARELIAETMGAYEDGHNLFITSLGALHADLDIEAARRLIADLRGIAV